VPTLLETQEALRCNLIGEDRGAVIAMLTAEHPPERLDIYRNTCMTTLTKALRLNFPAVQRLVGEEFFAASAARFIAANPPEAAYLDRYGAAFPEFLQRFPPAAALVYLSDVARLEWAVSGALHAADAEPLDCTRLAALALAEHAALCFAPHPSVALLRATHPVDAIWRAVLARDDAALATLDLAAGPVHLLIARGAEGVVVERMQPPAWQFTAALCASEPLQTALDDASFDATPVLAGLLSAGRFVDFHLGSRAS